MFLALSLGLTFIMTPACFGFHPDIPSSSSIEFEMIQTLYGTDSSNASSGQKISSLLPFLPPFTGSADGPQEQPGTSYSFSYTGTLTIKKVKVGTSDLLGNSTLMITPNPYTLKNSLIITDNAKADSDPSSGTFLLNNVSFGSYIINETKPPEGFGPILLKTRIAVHQTNPNPVVMIENRDVGVPFEGTAIVTPPSLNDSSFETFVRKGATIGASSFQDVDALPPGFIATTETELRQESKDLEPVIFREPSPVTVSASEMFDSFKIPTYPAPVQNVSSKITYLSPVFIVPQENEKDGSFLLTPIIAKAFPGMSLLVEPNPSLIREVVQVENIKMQFANESSNIGFRFGISDTIPVALMLREPPVESLKFIDVDFVGTAEGNQNANFSNPRSFVSSPHIGILVGKSANISKLADGCPDIGLFTYNESVNRWQKLNDPVREQTQDTATQCAYILQLGHFSKFSVGGVRPSSPQSLA
jgi:hypothetical protein